MLANNSVKNASITRAGIRGGATWAIAPVPRCKGAAVMKLICFK